MFDQIEVSANQEENVRQRGPPRELQNRALHRATVNSVLVAQSHIGQIIGRE